MLERQVPCPNVHVQGRGGLGSLENPLGKLNIEVSDHISEVNVYMIDM
jgi:hypothetical protein